MRRRSFVALIAAASLATGAASPSGRSDIAGYRGSYLWFNADPRFGGVSAIDISADGLHAIALSDRGTVVRGRIERREDGQISSITADPMMALELPAEGQDADFSFDTEGLALAPDGSFFISCELVTRVLHFEADGTRPVALPVPREFHAMAINAGLETLAIDADGIIYTVPEATDRPDGTFPVYRFDGKQWDRPFLIAGTEGFSPVDADFGPDGRLYLLERQFRGLGGFASRIRRLSPPADGVAEDEVLVETSPGAFGNLEGLSVWRDGDGALRLTMVADDNFLFFLGTEIVEFSVPG